MPEKNRDITKLTVFYEFFQKHQNFKHLFIKNIFLTLLFLLGTFCFGVSQNNSAKILSGNVNKEDYININKRVVDINTGRPIPNAKVGIPSKGIFTKTDKSGNFSLGASLKSPFILSVKAKGYKPFSAVINENNVNGPLIVGIKKQKKNELIIDSTIRHLGDNKFSHNSANATDFTGDSSGSYFFKEFFLDTPVNAQKTYLKIGSIIGIDTKTARRLKQSKVVTSYSSPVKIYLNSKKVGELNINGDNQAIQIPNKILRTDSYNTIRIETGVNLNTTDRTDYDDIEFMNLILEFK